MRLLTLVFASPADFLANVSEANGRVLLFARTKTEAVPGDALLIEIGFPGLPNRVLLRAAVSAQEADGLALEIDARDQSTADFMLALAHGEIEIKTVERSHGRFPATLPVTYRIIDGAGAAAISSTLEDLSSGGAFIRADIQPVVGSTIEMLVGPADQGGERFTARGTVAWLRDESDARGFGVELEMPADADGRTLRRMLRHASETGKVDFVE